MDNRKLVDNITITLEGMSIFWQGCTHDPSWFKKAKEKYMEDGQALYIQCRKCHVTCLVDVVVNGANPLTGKINLSVIAQPASSSSCPPNEYEDDDE